MGRDDGHQTSWAALLTRQTSQNGRLLFKLAYGILRNTQAAEDACQQALLQAWQQRDSLQDPSRIQAWLARIVINESLVAYRRKNRERQVLGQCRPAGDSSASFTEQLARRETVLLALASIAEPLRCVVMLRIMQGMSGQQVAELLGCSMATVSRHLHEGMEQLRKLLVDEQVLLVE